MKKEKLNFFILLLIVFILISALTSKVLYNVFDKYSLFVFLILDFFLMLINYNYKIKKNKKTFLLTGLIFIMLFSLSISLGGIGSFLSILNFVALLYLSTKIKIGNIEKKTIIFFIGMLYIICAYKSFFVWNNFLRNIDDINPNIVATMLLYSNIILSVRIENSNIRFKRLFIVILSCITLLLIINCHCRGVMIAICSFIAMVLFFKKLFSTHTQLVLWCIIIIGIIIPFLYTNKYFDRIDFLKQLTNKDTYTGREIIWEQMIKELSEKKYGLIIGLGSQNVTKIGVIVNYHNWYLGIIYMYGVFAFLAYFYYILSRIKTTKNNIIKIAFVSIFITGIFETSAIWIYIQILIFLLLLFDSEEIKNGKLLEEGGNNKFELFDRNDKTN